MEHISIISERKLSAMLEEDEKSKHPHIQYDLCEEIEGFLYSIWSDDRTGKQFAVREIRSVHMGFNSNEPGKEEKFVNIIEREGACKATWGVTGRTMNKILAQRLANLYPQYRFVIGDNYECTAYKEA